VLSDPAAVLRGSRVALTSLQNSNIINFDESPFSDKHFVALF